MISIDSAHSCIIELLKSALFGSSPIIPYEVNWHKVFEVAKAQCIVPLIRTYVPLQYRNEWNMLAYQSKTHFIKLLHEQNTLYNLFNDNEIPFVILKGTSAAIYYPSPTLRTYGDIDFLVPDVHSETAINLLSDSGYRLDHSNERHYVFEKNGMEFELHTKFSCQHYNDIEHIVTSGLKSVVNYKIGDFVFPGLPRYENGLILLGHIMQHLKDKGIGLRQIIDWMMFVHKELDDTAWLNYFKPLVVEAGLEKLAITVTYMCKKWLGLPDDVTWCDAAEDVVADQLLIRVLDDGNFGHDRSPHERVKDSLRKEGVFKYLQSAGIINWPLAQKYSIFRPFAWLYQLCRYVLKGLKRLTSGKKVFSEDINSMSLEELWKRLE